MDFNIKKFPRTPHLEGSRLQPGDEDLSQIPFSEILGKNIVVEEKIDGANSAISFTDGKQLLIQSRGHYLVGGYRERHYNLLKQWANVHREELFSALGCRYVMFGEWMYAKHTIFYDELPHYFVEFDIYDRQRGVFLDTDSRKAITQKLPIVHSVPVLARGVFSNKKQILSLLGQSKYISNNHLQVLAQTAKRLNLDVDLQLAQTDPSTTMEGLYIKVEQDGIVESRVKFVRASFLQCVAQSQSHWQSRPIVPNKVKDELQ
ncbi:MAG: RNA ligase family protein [Clostridia bacterium]|nr:RNA ligase family protein [Clostridia bacterium]